MNEKNTYTTPNGCELLKDWNDYERQRAKANAAARRLYVYLDFKNGTRCPADGLPFTSSSSFAAIWNTDAARLRGSARLYFDGVALDKDGAPVGIFTEYTSDGDELQQVYLYI